LQPNKTPYAIANYTFKQRLIPCRIYFSLIGIQFFFSAAVVSLPTTILLHHRLNPYFKLFIGDSPAAASKAFTSTKTEIPVHCPQ
jgi:hypothetical protein